MIMSFARPDSKTSAHAAPAASSRRCGAELGEPTSSSATDMTTIGGARARRARRGGERGADDREAALHVEHAGAITRSAFSRQPSK
jgi:hypothetical protein